MGAVYVALQNEANRFCAAFALAALPEMRLSSKNKPSLMNARIRLQAFAAIVACFLFSTAFAQQEQWLQYRTVSEGRAHRWLDLSDTPPEGMALPKLSANAQFGFWTTPLDPKGGRWFCLDRTARSGPPDRLHFDANGNGRLDDETPMKASRRDEHMAYFDPARLAFKGADGTITYHVTCRAYQWDAANARLLVGSGGFYEGRIDIGGKKRLVQLFDNTVNGAFNDSSANHSESDRIVIDGKEEHSRFLGRLLEVDDQLFEIEVAQDGAFIKLRPARNVAMGQVRVPETISEFVAVGLNGHFVRKPAQGALSLPAGDYRVFGWAIERKDKGADWRVRGSGFGKVADFTVSSEATAVHVGEPIHSTLRAEPASRGELSFSLDLKGSLGESVTFWRGSEQAPPPKLQLASIGGSYRSTHNFEFG
jgi:hypothetical protein